MKDCIIDFQNISIHYEMKKYSLPAVTDVSLKLERGKITALVGESGSGKTTLASALLNCISSPGKVTEGRVLMHTKSGNTIDILGLNENDLNEFRWSKVSMVFQGAQSSLNPIVKIFDQYYETLEVHNQKYTRSEAKEKFLKLLKMVNLSEQVLESYPHEISGGMKQRVMIAFSLLLDPEFIILDEPTTALDVITQSYIFMLLKQINKELKTTMLLLTHDIAVVAKYADNIGVMYAGRLMEYGSVKEVFKKRLHPYTQGLIQATPSLITPNNSIKPIQGTPPDINALPDGCEFHPRCEYCMEQCKNQIPLVKEVEENHFVRCFLFDDGGQHA